MFAAAAAAAAWHAHTHREPSKSPWTISTAAATITGAGIRAPSDAFEGFEDHEPPPPVTPVWDMDEYVQLDSPHVENLTISPAQLSGHLATQPHASHNPWTPAELQSATQQTTTTTMAMATTTMTPITTTSCTNPSGGGGSSSDAWPWDLSPGSSPGQSVFPSTTDLPSSTTRSSAVFSHTFSPLAHQFGPLPSSEPSQDLNSSSGSNDNNNPIVYTHAHAHTPHQLLLPSHFLYGPSVPACWPPAPLSHTLPIHAQHDISVPDPSPSAAIPVPAAPALHCQQQHIPFADWNFHHGPASPRNHFGSSSPPRSLIGFINGEYGPATVIGANVNPVMTQQPLAPATLSLPNASELVAHMSHLSGATASSGSPLVPDDGQVRSVPLQGWRGGRRDKSLPPPWSRNFTITQRSLPAAALQPPAPLASSLPTHGQSPFTSPPLSTRSPIFPVNADGSPQPPPLLFVNQTAQFSMTAVSPPSQGGSGSTLEEQGYSSTSLLRIGRGQKKRKRLPISDEFEEDSEDRKISDHAPTKSELHPPKQAPSMWQVFFTDWLAWHKNQSPHDKLNVAQAAKEAGVEYKNLSAEDKENLSRRVQLEKEERERRLQAWQKTLTPEDIKRENKFRAAQRKAGLSRRANIKDPNAPKKPLSAYFMFLAAIRSNPNLVREVFGDEQETTRQSVLAAKRWRDMSDEEKRPFLSKAEHDKLQYEAARKVYEDRTNVMTGTGYIIPDNDLIPDVAAVIFAARPSHRDASAAPPMTPSKSTIRPKSAARYDPVSTTTSRRTTGIRTSTPTTRRRNFSRRGVSSRDGDEHGTSSGLGSGEDSQESDEEWVPGSDH